MVLSTRRVAGGSREPGALYFQSLLNRVGEFDVCASGRQCKCLTSIDERTRECPDIGVQGSVRSKQVIEVLGRQVPLQGAPRLLCSDNGSEFVNRATLEWLKEADITCAFIEPAKEWQNGAEDSFDGKLRDECLSAEWLRSSQVTRAVVEGWRRHYKLEPVEFEPRIPEPL